MFQKNTKGQEQMLRAMRASQDQHISGIAGTIFGIFVAPKLQLFQR